MSKCIGSEPLTGSWLYTVRAGFQRAKWIVRRLSGDDAHERYLAHWHSHHAYHGGEPLDRAAFFRAEQARKWDGVRRCC